MECFRGKIIQKYSKSNIIKRGKMIIANLYLQLALMEILTLIKVSDTQLLKNSHRSGQESEEEERNFQKISNALGE
ncbi:MAG: hypothetical protein ACR5K2_03280 [Wolbachia sp.]